MRFLLSLLVVLGLVYVAAAAKFDLSNEAEIQKHFNSFMRKHGKVYGTEEFGNRYAIFKANLARINELQAKTDMAEFGITRFADLTTDEFRRLHLSAPVDASDVHAGAVGMARPKKTSDPLPASFDWRAKNVISAVKDQGQCGSCWAFSATESVESLRAIAGDALVELAPQQLVDCDRKYDQGCNGGLPSLAFDYIVQNPLMLEKDYPYEAIDDTCRYDASKAVGKISGYKNVSEDETVMAQVLVSEGPLSVALDATILQYYFGGVIPSWICGKQLDHAVQIVGYNDAQPTFIGEKVPAWIVRNSWGTVFGDSGFFYVQKGHGTCGINTAVTIPVV